MKTFEQFINEGYSKYGEVVKFYHATHSKNLESIKNGIDPKFNVSNHSTSQGGGFYVWNDIEKLKNWKGLGNANTIVEIQANLTVNNFEIDYELHGLDFNFFWQTLIGIVSKHRLNIYSCYAGEEMDSETNKIRDLNKVEPNNLWNYMISKYKETENYPYIIVSNETIGNDDVWLEETWSVDVIEMYPKSSKNIGWLKLVSFTADAKSIYDMIESLNKFGIKDEFKKLILNRCSALKYIGPKIYPTNYWSYKNGEMKTFEQFINENKKEIDKTLIDEYGKYKVYRVDGHKVRNLTKEHQEFGLISSHPYFKNLIPKNEIWIENNVKKEERFILIQIELSKLRQIDEGEDVWDAYHHAESLSKKYREKLKTSKEKKSNIKNNKIHKEEYCRIKSDETKVFLVDAKQVRDQFKSDFMEGGHFEVYNWIPKDELWIEKGIKEKEIPLIILHEFVERTLMKNRRMSYERSHEIAAKIEWNKRPSGCNKEYIENLTEEKSLELSKNYM